MLDTAIVSVRSALACRRNGGAALRPD